MRLETKIAALIVGAVVVVLGALYIGSGEEDESEKLVLKQDEAAPEGAGAGDQVATGEDADAGEGSGDVPEIDLGGADEGSDRVGSPAPRPRPDRELPSGRPPGTATTVDPATPPGEGFRTGLGDPATGRTLEDLLAGDSDTTEPVREELSTGLDEPEETTPETPGTTEEIVQPIETPAERPAQTPPIGTTTTGTDQPKIHVIEAGDNYSRLAQQYYGDGKYANRIAEANPDLHPRRLQIGAKVKIPPKPTETATGTPEATSTTPPTRTGDASPVRGRTYVVQPGDNWHTLSEKFLGDSSESAYFYEYNRERVGNDPKLLRAGTVIALPPEATIPDSEQ